jgi:hypothetical protein
MLTAGPSIDQPCVTLSSYDEWYPADRIAQCIYHKFGPCIPVGFEFPRDLMPTQRFRST